MKTLLTSICLFVICMGTSYSQDTVIVDPCRTDFLDPEGDCYSPWQGPYFMEICESTLQFVDFDCNQSPSCCFTVQYYDRLVYCDQSLQYYDVQVTSITAGNNCADCLEEYRSLIIDEVVMKKNYEMRNYFQMDWGKCNYLNHRTTKGACFHEEVIDGVSAWVSCSDAFCCAQWVKICYDTTGYVIADDYEILGAQLYSEDGVKHFCGDTLINCPDGVIECDVSPSCYLMPCDQGEWTNRTKNNIPVDGCPGCTINIDYRYRTTEGCTPTFYDYEILGFDYDVNGCSGCNKTEQEMFQFAMGYLLKYGEHGLPDDGYCLNQYRMLHESCWMKDPDSSRYYPCAETEQCCWSQYEICIDLGDTTITEIDGGYPDSTICDYPTQPCFFVCDLLPEYKSSVLPEMQESIMRSSSEIRPNPNNGEAELDLISHETGEMKLRIYSSNGHLQQEFHIQKSEYHLVYPFKLTNISNGVYFYKILKDNIEISHGTFTIIN